MNQGLLSISSVYGSIRGAHLIKISPMAAVDFFVDPTIGSHFKRSIVMAMTENQTPIKENDNAEECEQRRLDRHVQRDWLE